MARPEYRLASIPGALCAVLDEVLVILYIFPPTRA
jgi:hypothetical protein